MLGWEGVILGWGLGGRDAEPGKEGLMLGWGLGGTNAGLGTRTSDAETGKKGMMLGWEGVVLGWDRTGTQTGTSTERCWAGDRDGAMAGWNVARQGRGARCGSPHPAAGGLRGAPRAR